MRRGSGFIGSDSIKTSTAYQEIIPQIEGKSLQGYQIYKLSFNNIGSDCTIIINNGEPLHLLADQGFSSSESDALIHSFKIVQEGVQYNYIGAFI